MKHIMLLFLSEVHLNPDRTLSFSRYKNPDGMMIYCVQANESAVRRTADVLQKQGERLDCLFYFSTKQTQEEISYIDEIGDERTMTHEALFRERVQSFAAHCIGIDYDESIRNEESIRRALSMADIMGTFMEAQSWQPEDVELHVDVTGCFHHASMMMMAVMQLLKYRGVRTMSVLSSNRREQQVENVTDIYRLFNFISGAHEFIHFGNIREITAYMEGAEQTAETKRLLQTMDDFTNVVRICWTGKIMALAKELQEALNHFEKAGSVSLQEKIFLRILEVFKWEYGSLLKEDFTNFDIIRWCVEKGCLQQAMTLCSEWLPGEIVGRHIFYPVKDSIIAECNRQKANYQTWQQYFLNDFAVGQGEEKEASKEDHEAPQKEERSEQTDRERREQRMHTMVRVFECTGKFSSVSKFFSDEAEPFKPLLEELNAGHRALYDLKRDLLTVGQLKEKLPRIHTTLWAMYRQAAEDPDFTRTAEDYFKTRERGDVYEFLKMAPYELFQILLQSPEGGEDDLPSEENAATEMVETNPSSTADETLGDDVILADHENSEDDVIPKKSRLDEALGKGIPSGSNEPSEGYIFGIYCEDDNWNNRQANYLRLMNNGEAGYVRPARATLEILYNYWQIRIERNNINHANDQGSLPTEEIKDLVLDLLRRMENIAESE